MEEEELGKIVRSALNMFEQVVDLKTHENHHHSFFSCSNEVIPLLLLVASKVTPLRLHLVSATNKQASHLGISQEVCHPTGTIDRNHMMSSWMVSYVQLQVGGESLVHIQ